MRRYDMANLSDNRHGRNILGKTWRLLTNAIDAGGSSGSFAGGTVKTYETTITGISINVLEITSNVFNFWFSGNVKDVGFWGNMQDFEVVEKGIIDELKHYVGEPY